MQLGKLWPTADLVIDSKDPPVEIVISVVFFSTVLILLPKLEGHAKGFRSAAQIPLRYPLPVPLSHFPQFLFFLIACCPLCVRFFFCFFCGSEVIGCENAAINQTDNYVGDCATFSHQKPKRQKIHKKRKKGRKAEKEQSLILIAVHKL